MRPTTRRQAIALREYRRGHVTQRELASEWGITQPAVSRRLQRGRARRGDAPRRRYLPPVRVRPLSLSDVAA